MRISKVMFFVILIAAALPALAQEVKYKADLKAVNGWKLAAPTGWQNLGPSETWWRNQSYITSLSLTPEQKKKMDDVFQQARIKLIDVKAALDKEEAILEPLIEADRLDENKVALQLDKVADARAELEKATARMLLGIRQVLTPEQWAKLNSPKKGAKAALKYEQAQKIFGLSPKN